MYAAAMLKSKIARFALAATLLLAAASAQATVTITIIGTKAKADISVSNGGPTYTASVELEFKNPINLTEACLGFTAFAMTPSEITAVNARLPNPSNESIDSAFPVLIRVEPPSACGLEFDEQVDIEVHTPDLIFSPPSEYRLAKAPVGGAFHDVTGAVLSGSVRVRGSSGGFSEFVVAKVAVQNNSADATLQYDAVATRLIDPQIAASARTTLDTDLAVSRAAFVAGNYTAALSYLDKFDADVANFSGDDCPGHWRSQRDLDDAAGGLLELSRAVRFYLGRLNGGP